jgi:hypothetical protein
MIQISDLTILAEINSHTELLDAILEIMTDEADIQMIG